MKKLYKDSVWTGRKAIYTDIYEDAGKKYIKRSGRLVEVAIDHTGFYAVVGA